MICNDSKQCRKCVFAGSADSVGIKSKNIMCHYLLITGHRRGSDVWECDKYIPGKRIKLKETGPLSEKELQKALEERMNEENGKN